MNRNPVLFILVFGIFLSSCSQKGLMKLITKTPKVDYPKASNFKSFSKYQKDAIYATEIIKEAYPRLYEKVPEFDKLSFEFIRKAAETTDEKYFDIEVKKFISNLNDGHSDYSIDFSKYDNTRYPLFIFKEKENWIIGNVDMEIDSVVIGKRIISINNIPIREVEDKILKFESGENKYWKFREFLGHYNYPSYWEALNITSPKNRELKFEIENKEGISSFILNDQEKRKGYNVETKKAKYPFRFKQNSGFYDTISNNSNFAYLQMNTSLDYVSIKSEINNYTNFFTRPLALSFLKRMTKNARDFGKYLELFFKKVHEENIENLIIDLSYNTGGDERTGKQLIWYLTSQNPNGFKEFINNCIPSQ